MAANASGREVVIALQAHGADVERAVGVTLHRLAQETARTMRRLAPKSRSTLTNSIAATQTGPLAWAIGAHVDYAPFVEAGIKPGGKGLPRYFDPKAKSAQDWLAARAFAGRHKPRKHSRALQAQETELRDRYEGLAWHVRHFGVKARPFVGPTLDEMTPIAIARVNAAVRGVLEGRASA